jgi:Zn-dependent protease with chaperone function
MTSFEPRVLLENNVSPGHPLAELATLAAGLALVGLGLLLVTWLAVEGAVRFLPPSLEQRVFGSMASGFASPDDPRAAELDALLRRLSRHWRGRGYALHVGTTDAPEPNAFALPGGNVLVTSGLLAQAGSENELAFVLGHELGHVEGRDPLRALGRGLLVALALAALGGSDGSVIAGSAAALGERAFSRAQERAADRFALALVAAEYGHVAGASDFLRRLPDAGPAGAAERAAGWLSTHPRSDDRVAELEALARTEGFAATGALTPLSEALRGN